jgi:hypothetical protein
MVAARRSQAVVLASNSVAPASPLGTAMAAVSAWATSPASIAAPVPARYIKGLLEVHRRCIEGGPRGPTARDDATMRPGGDRPDTAPWARLDADSCPGCALPGPAGRVKCSARSRQRPRAGPPGAPVRRQVRGRTDRLVHRARQQHDPDERLAVPGVHLDHQIMLGTPLEPGVEGFPLNVARIATRAKTLPAVWSLHASPPGCHRGAGRQGSRGADLRFSAGLGTERV